MKISTDKYKKRVRVRVSIAHVHVPVPVRNLNLSNVTLCRVYLLYALDMPHVGPFLWKIKVLSTKTILKKTKPFICELKYIKGKMLYVH